MKYKNMGRFYAEKLLRHARFKAPEDGVAGGAAGGSGGSSSGNDGGADGSGGAEGTSFDDFLKDPKNQAEFDRRVSKALETSRSKMKADMAAQIAAAKTEAEKMAAMDAEQKAQYEREQKDAELTTREAAITKRELMATAKEQLAEKGLPLHLADMLNYSSAEECTKSIDTVEKAFKEAVDAGVEKRLAGGKPLKKAQGGNPDADLEKTIYNAMKGI